MMRAGGGKAKGASFERHVCKALSLWVSRGRREDCFWRSAMSGGRATVRGRNGVILPRQAGDITATSAEGLLLTDRFYIECKHHAKMGVDRLILGTGKLTRFWHDTCQQAVKYDRAPMLIARPNGYPIVILVRPGSLRMVSDAGPIAAVHSLGAPSMGVPALEAFLMDSVVSRPFRPMQRERVMIIK